MGHLSRHDRLSGIPAGRGYPGVLQGKRYEEITTLEGLRAAAQLAIQVEWTTIPAYLTALYSIKDARADAYQALRSVVVEEMFHINQAANILVGIGGRPNFTNRNGQNVVPRYPTHLPAADKDDTPYIGLYRASPAVFRHVFMAIEAPAPFGAPPQGAKYDTIGQLYKALEVGLANVLKTHTPEEVFKEAPGCCQRTDIYLGKFGGRAFEIVDAKSVLAAVKQIVQQGEGSVAPGETMVPLQPWGEKNHYGDRADGTYGPILGTPWELSHYFKFQKVANAESFPETYPIASNPDAADFLSLEAKVRNFLFNTVYTIMLQYLEASFTNEAEPNSYFKYVLPLMHHAMPILARELMTTPLSTNGNSEVGPNAAPTFEFVADLNNTAGKALTAYVSRKELSDADAGELVDSLVKRVGASPDDAVTRSKIKAELSRLKRLIEESIRR